MNTELRMILWITRKFPRLKGMGFFANLLIKFYNRKDRLPVIADVLDFKMEISPLSGILYYPQLHDAIETSYIQRHLSPGDVFIDVGANIGFYSLIAAQKVKPSGRVLSIEADPSTHHQLSRNLELSHLKDIAKALNFGVSDKKERLPLYISTENREGNSFMFSENCEVKDIECLSLLDILEQHKIKKISILKIDIEGYEYKVLDHFFEHAAPTLFPQRIIVEYVPDRDKNNTIALLEKSGYVTVKQNRHNYIMEVK
jgi:FkbM family methyltransferase